MAFRAMRATKTGDAISASVVEMDERDLMQGDVRIAVDYSTVNYRDALAITGRADVIRQYPLIPGIDSVNGPQEARIQAWSRLARDLDVSRLARTTQVVASGRCPLS